MVAIRVSLTPRFSGVIVREFARLNRFQRFLGHLVAEKTEAT